MARKRVYQLAKELGMSSKELIEKLRNELDIPVKNAQSGLDTKQVWLVKEFIKPVTIVKAEEKEKPEKKEEKKKKPIQKATEERQLEVSKAAVQESTETKTTEEKQKEMQEQTIEPAKETKKRKDIRILSPEEIVKRRRRRRKITGKAVERIRKKEPAGEEKPPVEQPVVQPEKTKEKKKTTEEIIAEKRELKREFEEQKRFREILRRIEEKNRAKAKKRKRKKKEAKPEEEIPFEQLSEEEQLRRMIEEEEREKTVTIPEVISVRELSEKLGIDAGTIISDLMAYGKLLTINQPVEFELAKKVIEKHGKIAKLEGSELTEVQIETVGEKEENLKPRPPVVTVMGHVDHGKTTLLDYIRKTKVAQREAGGITQHIGAYLVEVETPEGKKKITFLDTPGHEAFTAMRARGAQITDIAVLVVAADDGVMPQTIEAINHAKVAGVPIIVAINKIDRPGANPEKVKQELTQYGLIPEEWGGDTLMVAVSAKTGQGVNELLEMITLQAEMMELKASPEGPAKGVVIEAKLDRKRGPVATLLVQSGKLKVGDSIVAGLYAGKIRAMIDDKGKHVKEATPSMAVEVIGIDGTPGAGDKFAAVKDEKTARKIASYRQQLARETSLEKEKKVSLEDLFAQVQDEETEEFRVIVKADTQGSIEAIRKILEELSTDKVKIKIIHAATGPITKNDVMLASASQAIIIGFNVRPDSSARKTAQTSGVDIRTYRVIYDITNDIKKAMQGLLKPEETEVYLGSAEVRAIFKVPKAGTVAGCYVRDGVIKRNVNARLVRDGVIVYEGKIASLKRFKEDVREVQAGYECGIALENFSDIKQEDIIECYTTQSSE